MKQNFRIFFLNKEVRNIDKSFYTIQNLKVGFVQAKQNIQKITILNVTILDQLMSYYIHDFQIWRHIVFILSIFSKSMALVCQMSNSTDLNVCLLQETVTKKNQSIFQVFWATPICLIDIQLYKSQKCIFIFRNFNFLCNVGVV